MDPLSSAGKPAILVATGTTECNEIRQYFFLLASTVDNALDCCVDDKEDIKMAAIQTAGKTTNGHGSFTRIARWIPNLP